ncbi:hypothetical protein ABIB17_003354 [Arthrobacter sp. UYEF6]
MVDGAARQPDCCGPQKYQGEEGRMRISGDVVFLHILEDSNGRLELVHVSQ